MVWVLLVKAFFFPGRQQCTFTQERGQLHCRDLRLICTLEYGSQHIQTYLLSLMSVPKKGLTRRSTWTRHFIFKVRWIYCKYRHCSHHCLHWLVALVWDRSRSQLIRNTIVPFRLGKAIFPFARLFAAEWPHSRISCHGNGTANCPVHQFLWCMHLPLLQPMLSSIWSCHHTGPAFAPQKRFYLSVLTGTQLTLIKLHVKNLLWA